MHLQNIQDHQCCQYQIQQQDYVYMPLPALFEVVLFETPKGVAAKSLTLQQLNVLGTVPNELVKQREIRFHQHKLFKTLESYFEFSSSLVSTPSSASFN
jgi:hypothetical protein